MDLLYSGNLDAFAIVSSDNATSPGSPPACASPARPSTAWASARPCWRPLQAACDKFIFPRCWGGTTTTTVLRTTTRTPRATLPDLQAILHAAVLSTAQDDGWARSGAVGSTSGRPTRRSTRRHYGFPRLERSPALRTTSTSTTLTAASPASASAPSARPASARLDEGSGLGGRAGRPDREGHEGHEGREEDRGAGLTPSRQARVGQ